MASSGISTNIIVQFQSIGQELLLQLLALVSFLLDSFSFNLIQLERSLQLTRYVIICVVACLDEQVVLSDLLLRVLLNFLLNNLLDHKSDLKLAVLRYFLDLLDKGIKP